MAREHHHVGFAVLSSVIILVTVSPDQAQAAKKKEKEKAPPAVSAVTQKASPDRSPKAPVPQPVTSPIPPTKPSQPETSQKLRKQGAVETKSAASIGPGRIKVHKKIAPNAVARPREDLTYHGMLEDSQRYDPRQNFRTAGVPSPQTQDLTHDHFQELDRNRDGKIDPVERVFGRLDMDRDLHDRQPH